MTILYAIGGAIIVQLTILIVVLAKRRPAQPEQVTPLAQRPYAPESDNFKEIGFEKIKMSDGRENRIEIIRDEQTDAEYILYEESICLRKQ